MTNRLRKTIILLFLLFFILTAPVLILYSQGYRFDFNWQEKKIKLIQTGGIAIGASPNNVSIFLDGKLKKKTGIFFTTAVVNNLIPKKYNIRVEKEGYYAWEKNLEVKEKQVTEAKYIVLIPENLDVQQLSQSVEEFWILSENKILVKEISGEKWGLKIINTDRNLKIHLIDQDEISKKNSQLLDLKISSDKEEIYLSLGLKEQIQYYSVDLGQNPPVVTEINFLPEEIESEKVFVYEIVGNDAYYLDKSGNLFKNNLSFEREEKLSQTAFEIKNETFYKLTIKNNFIFLFEDTCLYLFDSEKKEFEKFSDSVQEIEFSPDNKKMLYFNKHEIWILFLEEQTGQLYKEAMSRQFINRFSDEIKDVAWLNSEYLVFILGDKIKVIEIDDRDRINGYDLSLTAEKFYWNSNNKIIYCVDSQKELKFTYLSSF